MTHSNDNQPESVMPSHTKGAGGADAVPFGANEMRLNARQWLAALLITLVFMAGMPTLWARLEHFAPGPDYRIPYVLSDDSWLYRERVGRIPAVAIPVVGDSVIWGEYVRPDGAFTHFLSARAGVSGRFANCGVNGLFPLSIEGLMGSYADALHDRKVILHCNMLWMSSPKADLSQENEETFNHAALVPQFFLRIPCYRADVATRLSITAGRAIPFFSWVSHLDNAYFDQQAIPRWTLADDGNDPPRYSNAWRNPLAQISLRVPGEPANDPQRGPDSPRHRAWNAGGRGEPTHFEWVPLNSSIQWHAFQRTVKLLRARRNDLFVIVGPFNEEMIAPDQRPAYRQMRADIVAWLTAQKVPCTAPETLPSALYADASHPLTQGYALLAEHIWQDPAFQNWLTASASSP